MEYMEEDGILGLPEGIIAHIYSFLTIKEAARTSILARRWKYIWIHYTHRLDFDIRVLLNMDLHRKVGVGYHEFYDTIPRYVEWVDHVLKSFQDRSINEFRINYGYTEFGFLLRYDMRRWVEFAIEKGVKRLELDFNYSHSMTFPDHKYIGIYPFPLQFCVNNLSFLRSLRDMSLTYVDVSDEALHYVLSKCYLLEKLCVNRSSSLVNLRVSSSSLKCLEIISCSNLERLQVVDSVNLVSLSYLARGEQTNGFMIRNVPRILELSFGPYFSTPHDILVKIPIYFPQLESLTYRTGYQEVSNYPNNFPVKFNNLKYLELTAVLGGRSILHFTVIVKACPSLYRLKVEIVAPSMVGSRELKEVVKEDSYKCLQLVELVGYPISLDVVEFIFHLVENAENLKKISIDPRRIWTRDSLRNEHIKLDEQVLRSRAMKEIAPKLPPNIEFALL